MKQELPHHQPKHRAVWQRQYQRVPRWARILAIATIAAFGIAGFLKGLHDMRDRNTKRQSTDFTTLYTEHHLRLPTKAIRMTNGLEIDDRYHYLRHLGKGYEGSASLYVDAVSGDNVVVKTFTGDARNPIPDLLAQQFANFTSSWPTEIEAGLLVGDGPSYVSVLDYFVLRSEEHWSWALVTPWVSGGTLSRLAKEERRLAEKSIEELDKTYRPAFNEMLRALTPLHQAGICHDDIKPDNVFVQSPDQWLLGDLGAMRHVSHPWHFAPTWRVQNQWEDCRSNDVRRALKSYLGFLRKATTDRVAFDRGFWERSRPWSHMYWDYVEQPVDAYHALESSESTYVAETTSRWGDAKATESPMWHKSEAELSRQTKAELTCTTVPRKLWKHWWGP